MCHHYERDTCLIHFKCCPEDAWYACHKCHNEDLGLVENLDGKGRENEERSSDHSDDNYTQATDIPGEMEDSSKQAETSSEHEGTSCRNKNRISVQYIVINGFVVSDH